MVAREYEAQCELLCFGSYPKWHEVESCFETIRTHALIEGRGTRAGLEWGGGWGGWNAGKILYAR